MLKQLGMPKSLLFQQTTQLGDGNFLLLNLFFKCCAFIKHLLVLGLSDPAPLLSKLSESLLKVGDGFLPALYIQSTTGLRCFQTITALEQRSQIISAAKALLHPGRHIIKLFLALGDIGEEVTPEFIELSIYHFLRLPGTGLAAVALDATFFAGLVFRADAGFLT